MQWGLSLSETWGLSNNDLRPEATSNNPEAPALSFEALTDTDSRLVCRRSFTREGNFDIEENENEGGER